MGDGLSISKLHAGGAVLRGLHGHEGESSNFIALGETVGWFIRGYEAGRGCSGGVPRCEIDGILGRFRLFGADAQDQSGSGEGVGGERGTNIVAGLGALGNVDGNADCRVREGCKHCDAGLSGSAVDGGAGGKGVSGVAERNGGVGTIGETAKEGVGSGGEGVASSGDSASVVSEKTLANRQRRHDKRDKKRAKRAGMNRADWRKAEDAKSEASEVRVVVKSELQQSLEAKWAAQNEMAVLKLKREKEIFEAQDVEALKKMQRSKILKATEKNLVAVEAAHNSLKRSGNVPGFAETVVSGEGVPSLSGGSDSISPNSSISEAEVWKMVKENEDLKAECARLKEVSRNFGLDKLKSGGTVAFTADNMSDAFEEKIREACDGAFTMETYPEDEETLYYKRAL